MRNNKSVLQNALNSLATTRIPNVNQNHANQNHPNQNHASQNHPNQNHPNPVELLNLEDISYIQSYLEQLKISKMKQNVTAQKLNSPFPQNRSTDIYDPISRDVPVDWRTNDSSYKQFNNVHPDNEIAGPRGAIITKYSKRSEQDNNMFPSLDHINDYYNPYECGSRQKSLGPMYKDTYTGPYYNDPVILNHMGIPQNMHQEEFPGKVRNINVESSLMQKETTHIPGQRKIMEREYDRFDILPSTNHQDPSHIVWKDNMPRGGYATRTDRTEY